MHKNIRIGIGGTLIGSGVAGVIALLSAIDLTTILNSLPDLDLWIYLISSLVGISLFLWSIVTGIALIRKYPKSPFWAAILMLLQTPYVQTPNFIFEFCSGVMLRMTLVDVGIFFGGQYQVGIPNDNVAFDIGVNMFSLVTFFYLLKASYIEKSVSTDTSQNQHHPYNTPFGSSRILMAILRPRNIAIFSTITVILITGAVLIRNATLTSMRAVSWMQEIIPELTRKSDDITAKYGSPRSFDTPSCAKGISGSFRTSSFEIQILCIINAAFDQGDVLLMLVLKEKGNSWEIREIRTGSPTPSVSPKI